MIETLCKRFLLLPLIVPAVSVANVTQVELPDSDSGVYWQALSTNQQGVLWVGSNHGHIARTEDGGISWDVTRPAGTSIIPITQIKALDEREAFALTAGSGSESRLYHTRNAGFSWRRVYRADGEEQLRCFDLNENGEAWILGDSLNGNWHSVRSANGRSWLSSRSGFDTPALDGEQAFNESGSCVRYANNTWAMGSAYGGVARLLIKNRTALRFSVIETSLSGTDAAITAVYPLANRDILFTGGQLTDNDSTAILYRWTDGIIEDIEVTALGGVLTNLSLLNNYYVVANSSGIAWSEDEGGNWQAIDTPVKQLSCRNELGCFALDQNTLIHFQPN